MSGKKVVKPIPKPSVTKSNSKPPVTNSHGKKCDICNTNVTARRYPGMSCFNCNRYFHSKCVSVSNVDLQILLNTGANWPCPKCKPKISRRSNILPPPTHNDNGINTSTQNSSRASTNLNFVPPPADKSLTESPTSNQSSTRTNLSNSPNIAELISNVKSLLDFKTSTENDLSYYSEKFDEIKPYTDKITNLTKRIEKLEKDNSAFKATIDKLESKIAYIEQQENSSDLILTGIPDLEANYHVSTEKLVLDFSKTVDFPLKPQDLKSCSRLHQIHNEKEQTSNQNKIPAKILLKFESDKTRNNFKDKIRNQKRINKFLEFKNQRIDYYVCDHLTKHYNDVLLAARSFAKVNRFRFVWVNESRILIKKDSSTPTLWIRSIKDLHDIPTSAPTS